MIKYNIIRINKGNYNLNYLNQYCLDDDIVVMNYSSFRAYFDVLEACLISSEEDVIIKVHKLEELTKIIAAGRDYAFSQFKL